MKIGAKMHVEITGSGDVWFEDHINHNGWYHPFRDYISWNWEEQSYQNYKRDCYWMVLE